MVFNGTITGTPALATGSGTENDPYQISTAEGLKWFRDKVNNAKTPDETKICAVLTADIDLNNEEWTPIGPSESSAYSKIVGYGQANNNPTNCYYLSDTDTDPAAKTAAEFADRTVVLKLLKAGRNDSPWDSCQYVATAGITLPVFNGQGDAHNANGGRQEQLRVTKQLFVVSELLVGQAAKFLPGKTANKEIARDNIIILKGTVQRQTIHFARIVADKRHIVL